MKNGTVTTQHRFHKNRIQNERKGCDGPKNYPQRTGRRDDPPKTRWTLGSPLHSGHRPRHRKANPEICLRQNTEGSPAEAIRKNCRTGPGTYFEPKKIKLSDWLDIWLNEYMGDKKYLTVKGYRAQCNAHIKPSLGAVTLSALTPVMIQKFYNGLKNDKDNKKGLAPKSVRNVHGILSKALNQAVRIGYIRANPCANVTLPRVERPDIKPLTDEQVTMFLKVAAGDEIYGLLLELVIFTGLRESEAMGLTWDCVDFEKGTLTINKQLQKRPKSAGGFVFSSLKNDKTRILKPAPFVMNLLKRRETEQAAQRTAAGEAWLDRMNDEDKNTLVFTTLTGTNLSPQTVYNHFKKLAAEIGAPDATVHDLRHTYAVLSLQNGDDVKTVQENLGHATASFTLDVYGHVSEHMQQASADRMERYIQSITNG